MKKFPFCFIFTAAVLLVSCSQAAGDEAAPVSPEPVESEKTVSNLDEGQISAAEVDYFTPPQGEGPYYPVDKPVDRDSDLTVLEGANGRPDGQIVEFSGTVYDGDGKPAPGMVIEIWQTDSSGVYLHPGDPGTDSRDPNFQFYGESETDAQGGYSFRTILPGHYEPRPRHIHVKVKFEGRELLTTQFYFEGDPELADEAMFNQVEGDGRHLVITLVEETDEKGSPVLIGQRDIVLNEVLDG